MLADYNDFSLSGISNDVCKFSVSNRKNSLSCESLNLFDLCLAAEDDVSNNKTSGCANDISVKDLSAWMDSSHLQISQSPVELDFLCTNDILYSDTKSKFKKSPVTFTIMADTIDTDILLSDCLDNSQGKTEYTTVTGFDVLDILAESSTNSEATDTFETVSSSKTNVQKHEFCNETADSEFLPDIDLRFCIKKNIKNDFLLNSSSPETEDSGFDERDFIPDKLCSPSKDNSIYKDILTSRSSCSSRNDCLTNRFKQSLFSQAISARPKIDNVRKTRVRKVLSELIKQSTPLNLIHSQHSLLYEKQEVIDHSNEGVIVSNFLAVPDEK